MSSQSPDDVDLKCTRICWLLMTLSCTFMWRWTIRCSNKWPVLKKSDSMCVLIAWNYSGENAVLMTIRRWTVQASLPGITFGAVTIHIHRSSMLLDSVLNVRGPRARRLATHLRLMHTVHRSLTGIMQPRSWCTLLLLLYVRLTSIL